MKLISEIAIISWIKKIFKISFVLFPKKMKINKKLKINFADLSQSFFLNGKDLQI